MSDNKLGYFSACSRPQSTIAGGSWGSYAPLWMRASDRYWGSYAPLWVRASGRYSVARSYWDNYVGFRCALTI